MKKLIVIVFLFANALSFAQSKKAINMQLRTEYHLADAKVDSLADIYGHQKMKETQMRDSLMVLAMYAYQKEREFNELLNDLARKSSDLKLLGVKSVEGMEIGFADSLVQKMLGLKVESILKETENKQFVTFFGFSKYEIAGLGDYSKKEQNTLLKMLIEKRGQEQEMLADHIQKTRDSKPLIHQADSALNFLNVYRDFMIPNIHSVQDLLDKELSKQRILYTKNGPTGFSLNYHRVFPDVFPETGPEINFNNQVLEIASKAKETNDTMVDEQAQFPGGRVALTDFMKKNFHYPLEAIDNGLEGKCYVRFLVSSSGEISEVSILKGVPDCGICDDEVIRFIKSMPNWIPGKIGGQPVNSYFTMPVLFKLD